MNKQEILATLKSDNKYLRWEELRKFAKANDMSIEYQNKYISWLKHNKEDYAICISCENVYGCQMINEFR